MDHRRYRRPWWISGARFPGAGIGDGIDHRHHPFPSLAADDAGGDIMAASIAGERQHPARSTIHAACGAEGADVLVL